MDEFSTPIDNPLVPKFPIAFRDVEIVTVIYRTRAEAIRAILPDPLEPVSDYGIVHAYRMNDAEWFGRYDESAVQVECRLAARVSLTGKDERGAYSPYLPNAQAPVYRLPVLDVVAGFYWVADFTLPFGQVWYDYLK